MRLSMPGVWLRLIAVLLFFAWLLIVMYLPTSQANSIDVPNNQTTTGRWLENEDDERP
jgi:hypothetical protein